jgi:serine/threonine-protein kinase
MRDHERSPDPWRRLQSPEHPPAIRFWYRESPEALSTVGLTDAVTPTDPPPLVPGMAMAVLDPGGRLVEYAMVPPDTVAPAPPDAALDWAPLFTAAGIDAAALTPGEPHWTPDGFADSLAAWTIADSMIPGGRLRIEAAAFQGQPVHFLVAGPWRPSSQATPQEAGKRARMARRVELALILAMLGGAVLLTVRNLRLGRSDRKNAFRLAAYLMVVNMLGWLISGKHVASTDQEISAFIKALGPALFFAGSMWLIYLALEPYIRRNFPHRLISWTRLMSGRFRDPLVGRDVLVGVVSGLAIALLINIQPLVPAWFGQGPAEPALVPMSSLLVKTGLGNVFKIQTQALFNALFFLFMPLLFLVVFRNYRLSLIAFFLVFTALITLREKHPQFAWPLTMIMVATWIGLMMRYGLLTLAVSFFVMQIAISIPLTTNVAAWYAAPALPGILAIVALAIYGLRTALGGRPLFSDTSLLRD